VPELQIGETGIMTVQGFEPKLPFTQRAQVKVPEAIHVEFDLGQRRDAYQLCSTPTSGRLAA